MPHLVEDDHQFTVHVLDHIVIERGWEVNYRMADVNNDHDDVRDLQNSPPMFSEDSAV